MEFSIGFNISAMRVRIQIKTAKYRKMINNIKNHAALIASMSKLPILHGGGMSQMIPAQRTTATLCDSPIVKSFIQQAKSYKRFRREEGAASLESTSTIRTLLRFAKNSQRINPIKTIAKNI